MDIVKAFNNNEHEINIIIKGTYENPLFRASDIGEVLGMSQIHSSIRDFDDSEKVMHTMHTLGGPQEIAFLTEIGLYNVLFRSRNPIAKKFKNWVCEVIKEIRLNGSYTLNRQLEEERRIREEKDLQLEETNAKLEEETKKREELKQMLEDMQFKKGQYIYIFDLDARHSTIKLKKLKIGVTGDLHIRVKPYKQIAPYGKMVFSMEIPENTNLKLVEKWIHMLLKPYNQSGEVFEMEINTAKMWIMRVVNTLNMSLMNNEIEKLGKISKVVDSENAILDIISGKASTCEVSTQTDPELSETTNDEKKKEDTYKFEQFINEQCILGDELEAATTDIAGKYRIWSRNVSKEVYHALLDYLSTRFKPVRLGIQDKDYVINGYRGIAIKKEDKQLSLGASDPEVFLWHMCKFDPSGKILFADLFTEYERWATRINKQVDTTDLKNYLKNSQNVLIANVWTPNGNGQGLYGLCVKNDIIHQKKPSTTAKKVLKKDKEGNVIDQWSTIAKAAQAEGISAPKMSRIINNKVEFNNYFYTCETT